LCLLSAVSVLAPRAHASFIGFYDFSSFTLSNQDADGTAMTPDGGLSVVITGGNTGSGLPGITDFLIVSPAVGMVHFEYSYFSLDIPLLDEAGYVVDGAYTMLADTSGGSGSADFSVNAGSTFGFRVATLDNEAEPGVFTISDFSAPLPGSGSGGSTTTPTPEPASWTTALLAVAAGLLRFSKGVRS
jgi:hypothetical protein